MIRAVVVEDEPLAREYLTRLLMATGKVEVVGVAEDTERGLQLCRGSQAEAAFLDIHLPGLDGLSMGAALAQTPGGPLCVFVTAFPQHAVAAFEVHAVDYLLKPLDPKRVEQAVEYLCRRLQERQPPAPSGVDLLEDRLPVRLRERDVARLLERHDIVAVLRKGRRTWIHTQEAEYPSYLPVAKVEAWLGGQPFFRAARDAIVNLDQVAEITHFGDRLYHLQLKDRRQTIVKASRSAASHLSHRLRVRLG